MLLLAVVTSDSATPKLSTRLRMMETAWLSASLVTFCTLLRPRCEDDAGAALEVEPEARRVLVGEGQLVLADRVGRHHPDQGIEHDGEQREHREGASGARRARGCHGEDLFSDGGGLVR